MFYLTLILLWGLLYKVFVDILGIWKVYNFPSPKSVGEILWHFAIQDNRFVIAIFASLRRVLIGYGIALFLGLTLGFITTKVKVLREQLTGLFIGLQTLPNICWLPFAILWFGLNEKAIIVVVVIGATFTISIATEAGIRNINPMYVKAARTMGYNELNLYWRVILPAAFPAILAGMRQGWSFAWRGLIAGEMFVSAVGLGQMLMMGREMSDINRVAALMVVIIFLGVVIDRMIFAKVQNRVSEKWGT